jgi:propane monooxygenase large subunit
MEYSSDGRSDPRGYMDKWERWIENDWYRSYVLKLGKLGLNFPPRCSSAPGSASRRLVREHAQLGGVLDAALLAHGAARRARLQWFESKYPGWYAQYGRRGRRSGHAP